MSRTGRGKMVVSGCLLGMVCLAGLGCNLSINFNSVKPPPPPGIDTGTGQPAVVQQADTLQTAFRPGPESSAVQLADAGRMPLGPETKPAPEAVAPRTDCPERLAPPTVMKPLPPIEPAIPEQPVPAPMEKREGSAIEPMVYKAPEQPTSLAAQAAGPKAADAQRPQPAGTNNSAPAMRMVNSRRVLLDYDLKDVAGTEQTVLELWYTQDGRHWYKDATSVKTGSPYVVEVNKEGTYGFTMVARGPSEKSAPPAAGELPQVWVEVDWTKPVVNLVDVRAGPGPLGRSLALVWTATDNNLAPKPIALSYSEQPQGPWKTFASSLENTGRYVWQVPGNVPANVYVRLEASDLVGNTAAVQTPQVVQLP